MALLYVCHKFGLKVRVRSLYALEVKEVFSEVGIDACVLIQEEVEVCEVVERMGGSDGADVLVSVCDTSVCMEPLNGVVGTLCKRGDWSNVCCDEGASEEDSPQFAGQLRLCELVRCEVCASTY